MEPMAFKYHHSFGAHFSVCVFYWSWVALQFCVIFCYTEKWTCYPSTYILSCHHRALGRTPGSITWVPISYLFYTLSVLYMGFSAGSALKTQPANVGEARSIPELGRSPGEGDGYPLQYSCLRNPKDRGAWWAKESQTQLSDWTATMFTRPSRSPSRLTLLLSSWCPHVCPLPRCLYFCLQIGLRKKTDISMRPIKKEQSHLWHFYPGQRFIRVPFAPFEDGWVLVRQKWSGFAFILKVK